MDKKEADGWTEESLDQMIEAMEHMRPKGIESDKPFEEQLEELASHPAFMKEVDPSQPLSPEMEGLMRLKYESDDPVAKAESYKEDGNHEFKKKKYRVAIDNYTEAIKVKCPDLLLNAVLYTNRAAAQYHIGNFRTAYNDCRFARKFKNDHVKAIHRGAMCLMEMNKYDDCIQWCDDALQIDSKDAKILELRAKATKAKKAVERDLRKEQQQERKALEGEIKLLQAIQSRGIKLAGVKQGDGAKALNPALLTSLEVPNPMGSKVHLDANNVLYWPVIFMYPEHTETDYIQTFPENLRIIDQLNHTFGLDVEPPKWDPNRHYKPHCVNVYFEDRGEKELHKVKKEHTLLKVLQHPSFKVHGGTPVLIITVAGSPFEKSFLDLIINN